MAESVQIFLAFGFMVAMYFVSRSLIARKLQKVSESIIKELEAQEAFDPFSAAPLAYSKPNLIRLGTRDYHYQALEFMINEDVIGKTSTGKYFLKIGKKRSVSF